MNRKMFSSISVAVIPSPARTSVKSDKVRSSPVFESAPSGACASSAMRRVPRSVDHERLADLGWSFGKRKRTSQLQEIRLPPAFRLRVVPVIGNPDLLHHSVQLL